MTSRTYGTRDDAAIMQRARHQDENSEDLGLLSDSNGEHRRPDHGNGDGDDVVDGNGSDDGVSDKTRLYLAMIYMAAMGVCGIVLVAIGQTLEALAVFLVDENGVNLNYDSTDIGSVFLARGLGAILGAVVSAKLYIWFSGPLVMGTFLSSIGVLFLKIPYNTNVDMLHFYFFFLGLATAVTDTGCQIMTRKLHGKSAGPWLGANTVVFGVAGAIVPVIEIATDNFKLEYFILAIVVFVIAFAMFTTPDVNTLVSRKPQHKQEEQGGGPEHYHVEMIIAFMVFMFIGSKVTLTSYLYTYVNDTAIIEEDYKSILLLCFWIAIAIGRLAGVYDQRFVTNTTLPIHLFVQSAAASLSMLLILLFPYTASAFWIGIIFFGLFNGPCIGYCYDYNNRLTYPSELSMALVMLGLNFGASLVPWLTSYLWNKFQDPYILIWVCLVCNFVPMCLVFTAKKFSYDPKINPEVKREEDMNTSEQISA